jgi:hypothetical protein
MQILLPLTDYQKNIKTRKENGQTMIYDPLRKKYLVLQPEEFVRQLLVQYLLTEKKYPAGKIAIEVGLKVNELQKRCDILVYDQHFKPFMIVECKAAQVPLNEAVFYQIANYNMPLKVPYLLVSNGLSSYCCQVFYESQSVEFLSEVPTFSQ